MDIIILGLLTAISLLIILVKFMGWKNVIRFHKSIDIFVTLGAAFFFMGTFSGIATGIITGIFLSFILWIFSWFRRVMKAYSSQ